MLLSREGVSNGGNEQERPCFRLDSVDGEKKNHARGNVKVLVIFHGLVEARGNSHPNFLGIHVENGRGAYVKFK